MLDMRIGRLAREAGTPTSAIRYYERHGLLPSAKRTESGYRLYEEESLARLRFIRRAKNLGLSLTEIKQLLDSPDARAERARLRHLVAHKLAAIKSRVEELDLLAGTLERLYVRLVKEPEECSCRHFGECDCSGLEPTSKEVMRMATEIEKVKTAAACSCGCDACAGTGTNCGCGCCGATTAKSEVTPLPTRLSPVPMMRSASSCGCGCGS